MSAQGQVRERFLREYGAIRHAEGRGSQDREYYRALPFLDLSGKSPAMWRMRARTYRCFEKRILPSLERKAGRRLRILDLGAGNCWLSYRLALRGHNVVAIDIFNDRLDGLGAASQYDAPIAAVEADFDQIPVGSGTFDLAIFNSSFHYSTDYVATLQEVERCLRPDGCFVILDSPVYSRREHGERMVAERHAQFQEKYGFRSDAMPSIEFLDLPAIRFLRRELQLEWQVIEPWYGWRWHLRPLQAWLRRKRQPSRFWIFTGRFCRP